MTATPAMRRNSGPKKDRVLSDELLNFMKEECKPVKGIFKNYECPGGAVKIVQSKYPNQPVFEMLMIDGHEYEVPLWVARWLNGIDATAKNLNGKVGSCSYPKHEYALVNDNAIPIEMIGKRVQRYGFQSLEFFSAGF